MGLKGNAEFEEFKKRSDKIDDKYKLDQENLYEAENENAKKLKMIEGEEEK